MGAVRMSEHAGLTKRGCVIWLVVAVGVVALFWSAGGVFGLMHVAQGRNPWKYVAPTPERREQTLANAQVIIAALERWKAQRGEYPATLAELVRAELPEIPPSKIGDRIWNYSRPTPGRFVLDFFEGSIYQHTWWDSDKKQWDQDH